MISSPDKGSVLYRHSGKSVFNSVSKDNLPCSISCRIAAAVNCLVIEPILSSESCFNGTSCSKFAEPNAFEYIIAPSIEIVMDMPTERLLVI